MGTRLTFTSPRRRVAALLSVAALLTTAALAGCQDSGGSDGSARGARPTASDASGSPSPSGPAAGTPSGPGGTATPVVPSPSAGGSSVPGEITVTGQVEDGVEPGCLLLRAPDQLYLLIGGDRARLAAGGRLAVRGVPDPGALSTCQQGTPLKVLAVGAP